VTAAQQDHEGPADIVRRWVTHWSALDAVEVIGLFAPDATYVSGRDGELDQLSRRFAIAARSWQSVKLEDVSIDDPLTDGGLSVVAARYAFRGVDRHDRSQSYSAATTFVLRREASGSWKIARFQETFSPGGVSS
jgi:uncharacterized protein (TIGR02246 family)